MTDFTPAHVHAVHAAIADLREASKRWNDKRPGCTQAVTYARKADELVVVRDMILDRLPPEFASHRRTYRDYKPR